MTFPGDRPLPAPGESWGRNRLTHNPNKRQKIPVQTHMARTGIFLFLLKQRVRAGVRISVFPEPRSM